MTDNGKKIFDDGLHVLKPGEFYATSSDRIIGTVTGSSVVVCLYDQEKGIGGMCHFIVPGTIGTTGLVSDEIARFGVSNMELLLGDIVKLGGDRKRLKAKVYGSGAPGGGDQRMNDIARGNVQFVEQYFQLEKIGIEDEDLGGGDRKKIVFEPKTGTVRKDSINSDDAALFVRLEAEYIESVFKNKDKTGDVVIF
jgi:chemotaxis protein CheD